MIDLLRLAVVLTLIVVFLRRKLKVGYVMLMAAGGLALLYLMNPVRVGQAAWDAAKNPTTIQLLGALALIRMLEAVLREHGHLKRMMEACRRMFRSRRATLISMPLLIGMLPSVGGAYFSAPLVGEASDGLEMSREEKSFINYWFRHPWEYVSPMYPGVLLAAAVSGVKLQSLLIANLPYALIMLATGFAFSMHRISRDEGRRSISRGDIISFIPILAVLIPVMAFGVRLWIALSVVVAGLFVSYRYRSKQIGAVVKHGLSPDIIILIFGVMFFKEVMEASGSVAGLSRLFAETGVPLMPTLLILPFLAGILTGLAIGFVGATFPLLISLAGRGDPWTVSLAFGAGFMGVMLSPVHVCLILTCEYFEAHMPRVYRRMLIPSALVLVAASAQYLLLR